MADTPAPGDFDISGLVRNPQSPAAVPPNQQVNPQSAFTAPATTQRQSAYTVTPLSGQAVDQNLARRLTMIKNAAPIFGASQDGIKTATAMAQSGWDDETLIKNVKYAAAQNVINSIKDQINAQADPLAKWKLYSSTDDVQKGLLKGSGFVAPEQVYDPGDTSVLGVSKSIVGNLIHDVTNVPGIKQVLGAVAKPLSEVQHLYRVASLGVQEEGFFGLGGTLSQDEIARRHQIGNWGSDFLNLWDRTGNGEKTFTVNAMDRVHQAIPEADKYNFVNSMAGGDSVANYLTKTLKVSQNDPTFTDQYMKYSQYLGDQHVQDAITDLKNNKISFGRDLAGGIGLKRGTAPFTVLSGGLDATADILGDPTLWLTEGLGEFRFARSAISKAVIASADPGVYVQRVNQLAEIPKFSKAIDNIALRFSEGNTIKLMDEMPSVRKAINGMNDYFKYQVREEGAGITRDNVLDYFRSDAAKMDLLAGNFSVPHFEGMSLPRYGMAQQLKSGIIIGAKANIDAFRLADYGLDGMSLNDLNTMFPGKALGIGPKWGTIAAAQNGIGEFLKGMVTKVPHQTWINPMDEKAPQVFRSMMDYVLPKDMQEGFMNDFLAGSTVDARREAYNSAIDAMWQYSGAYQTDAGKDIYRTITQADQVYMGNGLDRLNGTPAGILESDAATAWAIPTFKNMLQSTKDITTVRRALDATDDGLVGKFMNHWRPTVLLRAGFVPRAYGEELLSFVSREGLKSLASSYAATAAVSDKEALLTRPMSWLADSMLGHIPYAGDHVSMLASNMAMYADSYFKNFAEKLAPDEYLAGARDIAQNNAIKNAMAREAGTYHGMADEALGERARREQINVKSANGDIAPVNVQFGQIVSHMRGDAFYHHTVYREMRRIADSELAKPVLDGMRRQILPEEGERLVQILQETGALPGLEPHIPTLLTEPKLEGMTRQEYLSRNAEKPTDLRQSAKDNSLLTHPFITPDETPHPDIFAHHDMDSSTYHMYDSSHENLIGQLEARHGNEGTPMELKLQVHPDYQGKGVDRTLMETADDELMASLDRYAGYEKTTYGAGQQFERGAQPESYQGEPIPRTDLNYGQALLRARQQVPEGILPKFEQYLKNHSNVSSKAVEDELVANGMPESQAQSLTDALRLMTPRQRIAIYTQDGPLERMLQAKILDPNAAFDMAAVPGYVGPKYYHGSYSVTEEGKLYPIHYKEGNLYGPGFYTTEDPAVADSYTMKATQGQTAREGIYQMGWQGKKPPNLINLDQPIGEAPPKVKEIIEKHFGGDATSQNLPDWLKDQMGFKYNATTGEREYPDFTVGHIIENLANTDRAGSTEAMLSGNAAKDFIKELNDAGYDGYTHIGGGRAGGGIKEHQVSIFFDTERLGVTKPPHDVHVPGFLPTVRSAVETQARRQYEEHLLNLWSMGGSSELSGAALARERLSQGDMSQYASMMRRGQEVDNDVVAHRPSSGSRRVYTVLGSPQTALDPAQELRFAPLGGVFDHQEGWVPLASSHAYEAPGKMATYAGETMPAENMAWFSTDHHDAQFMQQKLLRYKPDSGLRVGYVDVPEDVFKQGRDAAKTEGAAGLHPTAKANQASQVWLPKSWRGDYQALSDEGVLLEPQVPDGHVRLYTANPENTLKTSTGEFPQMTTLRSEAEAQTNPEWGLDTVHYVDVPHTRMEDMPGDHAKGIFFVNPDLGAKIRPLDTTLSNGVDQSVAFDNWGHKVSQKVHQVFGGQDHPWDETMANVIHNAVEGDLKVNHLWDLKTTQLPEYTVGPQIMTAHPDGMMKSVYRWGFDHITQAGDAMIRSPMFLHNYVKWNQTVRDVVQNAIGDATANAVISKTADQLGNKTSRVLSAWHSLPDEVKSAVNPLEAAYARDPIPHNLRLLEAPEDFQKLAGAAEALYMHKDPELLKQITKDIERKNQGIRGVFTSIPLDEHPPSLDDLVDSYLSLPEKMRTNVLENGMPDVFPKELMGGETPLSADQWTDFRNAIDKNKHIEETIRDITTQRAVSDTIPWIHDHHLRSQFQEHARNFIPFMFAQENFIGRVGNLVVRDPQVIRKAQLAVHGLQTFGAIDKNQFGEDVFNIPGTGALMQVLQKGADIFGKYSIPIVDPMSGQLKYALPGLDEMTHIAPSFSPVVSIPLQGLTRMFPELGGAYEFVAGTRGQGRSVIEQLVPSWAYNTYRGLVHDPNSDHAMVSTMIQTAQRMEAAGLGIPEKDAASMHTPSQQFQEYIDRLQNHTRLATLVKGLVGFFSPVSPDISPHDAGLSQDFQDLLRVMPLDQALTAYMQQHPDGLPYTVMKSKVTSGAPLPSSTEALSVMETSKDFLAKYPNAGAWFLPQATASDSYTQKAYNEQLAQNLRVNKSLKDWYKDYYFAGASKDYFDTEHGYQTRYAEAKGSPQMRQQLKNQWDTWKQAYFGQHPVFAEEIQSPEGKQRRARIINEMGNALADPAAPQVPHAEDMRNMLDTYNGLQKMLGQYNRGSQGDQIMRQQFKDMFNAWAITYNAEHPQVNAFYNRVIHPEVGN